MVRSAEAKAFRDRWRGKRATPRLPHTDLDPMARSEYQPYASANAGHGGDANPGPVPAAQI